MAFPVLQVASALLKTGQDAEEASEARQKAVQQHLAAIHDRQTRDVFGGYRDPYQPMSTQFKSQMGAIDRAEQENSNNNIGSMLQQYFMSQKDSDKKPLPPRPKKEADGFGIAKGAGASSGLGEVPGFSESFGEGADAMDAVDELFGNESTSGDLSSFSTQDAVTDVDSLQDPWAWDSGY